MNRSAEANSVINLFQVVRANCESVCVPVSTTMLGVTAHGHHLLLYTSSISSERGVAERGVGIPKGLLLPSCMVLLEACDEGSLYLSFRSWRIC